MRTYEEQTSVILIKTKRYNNIKKKRLRVVYSISAAAACLVIAVVVFSLFFTAKQDDGSSNGKDSIISEHVLPEVYSQRLTSIACQVDDWIYYAHGVDGIYKINVNGTQYEKINDDYATFLQVHDGWIYYSCADVGLVKVRLDGSDRSVLLENIVATGITVEGDWIYCTVRDWEDVRNENYKLIKLRTDGTEEEYLINGFTEAIVSDEWIYFVEYYRSTFEGAIYKIRKDGSEKKLIYDDSASNLVLDGDYLYYHMQRYENVHYNDDEGWGSAVIAESALCRIKTDGSDKIKLANNDVSGQFTVQDGWIYYIISNPYIEYGETLYEGSVYKVYFDGTQQQKLFETDVPLRHPIAAGDWIYFRLCNVETDENGNISYTYSDADDINLYKVKKDGTEAQSVNLYCDNTAPPAEEQEEDQEEQTDGTDNYDDADTVISFSKKINIVMFYINREQLYRI